ncbi:hypothetical protein [Streptomyces narbonensis]|uniref:hypothetical protein n=1 Tax=Streptomyces narbonensis TaxID=67333 RepID=UPI001674F06C|nr:hypothetical protein [Streptomyces narbonensis]GGW00999.1 hypothetical protein GCM10010230_30350 [Streptomyces narbonensis]
MTTPGTAPDPETGPGSAPAPDPDDSATRAEVDRIREAFAREAFGVTPSPVPLAAVRSAGRSFRRRRTATFSALSALGAATVAAAVVVAVAYTDPSSSAPAPVAAPPATVTPRAPSPTSSPEPTSTPPRTSTQVRVVAPGERVDAGKGWKVWLTAEGKHWVGPDGLENSRSVIDGNVDTAEPGVSHQSSGNPAGAFHSGLYYGTRAVGGVELTGPGGERITATLLELPGRPGWGVWYAHTGATSGDLSVAMYDRAGKLLSALPG